MGDCGGPSGGNDLGSFLRARRAALDPRRAGLSDNGRQRRVPGLRREELPARQREHRAAALLTDFGAMPPPDRNLVRLMFLDHAFRSLYADWPRAARDCVAVLRMEAGQHPDDPDLIALVGELSIRDPDFRAWWTSHPVHGLGPVPRTFDHPVAGTLTLDVHQLSVGTPRPAPRGLHRPARLPLPPSPARPPPLIRCLHRPGGRRRHRPERPSIDRSGDSPDKGSVRERDETRSMNGCFW
jgi:hypothetical protein